MALMEEQAKFLLDVVKLIEFIAISGYRVTGGHLYRTLEQQKRYEKEGKSKAGKWKPHCNRLAIDLNFFKPVLEVPYREKFVLTYDKKDIQEFGDYWESLNPINKWGGNWTTFVDTPHFERRIPLL